MADAQVIICEYPINPFKSMRMKSNDINVNSTDTTPLYSIQHALAGFKAGTHQLISHAEMNSQGRPNGNFVIHCYPVNCKIKDITKELCKYKTRAIMSVSRTFKSWNTHEITMKITPLVRADLLKQHVLAQNIVPESNNASDAVSMLQNRSPVSRQLENVPEFLLTCLCKRHIYSKIRFLIQIKGHRILFIEPESAPFLNKRLVWEVRLLFPNYPMGPKSSTKPNYTLQVVPSADATNSSSSPVEGVHYKLLMRHTDESRTCCCGPCFGANGSNGNCKVELDLIYSLNNIQAPRDSRDNDEIDQSVTVPEYTADELTLSILAFIPYINSAINVRKTFLLLTIPLSCLSLVAIILNIYNIFIR